jgi:tetratricopeptide (TPR) repeat protein
VKTRYLAPTAVVTITGLLSIAIPTLADESQSQQQIERLTELVREGRCGALLEQAAELQQNQPADPDVMVLQGNCELILGRSERREFDPDRLEDMRIAFSRPLSRAEVSRLGYSTVLEHDAERLEKAERLFRSALELEPRRTDLVVGNVALLVNTGRVEEGLELVADKREMFGPAARNDLGKLAEDLLRRGQDDEAELFARGLSETLPDSANGPVALAEISLARGRALEALSQLEEAHRREPARESVTTQLAEMSLFSGEYERATELLVPVATSAVELQAWLALAREASAPGSAARIWKALREKLGKAGQVDEASARVVEHYRRMYDSDRLPTAVMRLRAARTFRDISQPLPALTEARAALKLDPSLIEARVFIAEIYRSRGAFDLSVMALDEAIERIDETPAAEQAYGSGELLIARARALVGLGEYDDALDSYSRAAAGGGQAPDERAWAALRAGEREQAVGLLRQLVSAGGDKARWAGARLERLGVAEGEETP